jgi:3-hydroxy-3-methylglutaryl CoA synthase
MSGIVSYGAYVPLWRLSRDAIGAAWDRPSFGGERSVANNDEDPVTMAVEAVLDCLGGIDRDSIDGLYFASTTAPFQEKQCAALIAAAADFKPEIVTADFGNSLRAGTSAMRAALDAVNSGSAENIIVAAADCRLGYPRSDYEQNFGDAAVALLISKKEKPVASVKASQAISNEMYDVWRLDKDTFVQSWEDRFIIEHGYIENMSKAITGLMKKQNLTPGSITKAVLYAPTARTQQQLARQLGFDPKTQLQDLLASTLGVCGCAHTLLLLVTALEEAQGGDNLLVASYGDGSDAFLIEVTAEVDKIKTGRRGVKGFLSSKLALSTYERYLSYRGILEPQPGESFRLFPSASVSWRERNWSLRFHGSKCKNCGLVTFPIQRVCYQCQSKDNYEEVRLSDKRGKVFTFSLDNLAGRSDDPVIPQIVIESELDNARIYCIMTDCDPKVIKIGMPVEMTFRRIYEGAGMYNYFWKCRPIR